MVCTALLIMSNSSCSRNKKKDEEAAILAAKKQLEQDSLIAARTADSIANAQVEETMIKGGYLKARIIDKTGLDGCAFLIELQSGEKLIPLNLRKEFRKDNLNVWVKYKKEDAMTVCMAGETVRIVDIAERK